MKTIEEAAKEYQTKIYEDVFEEGSLSEQKLQCINDFKAGIAFAEEWISVEDELPERCKKATAYNILVLKTEIDGEIKGITLGYLMSDCWYTQLGKVKIESITHWRPINRK